MRILDVKEIQAMQLELMKKLHAYLTEKGIPYYMIAGSALGALRHGGFIPWDDDIDIQMPRPDYERFLSYLIEHPCPHLKVFNHKYVKGYPLGISRIADMRYKIEENILKGHCDMGIFVDVYPIDGLADSYEGAKNAYALTDRPRANLLRIIDKEQCKIKFKQLFSDPKYFISNIILRLKGLAKIQMELEETASSISFENSKYVGIPNWNWIQLVYKKEWYENFIKVPFEDSEFFISKFYDDILRAEYGDYMQLPPVEKRVYHHGYLAYKR